MKKILKKGIVIVLIMIMSSFSFSSVFAVTQAEKEQLISMLDTFKSQLGDLNEFKQVIDKAYGDLESATTVTDDLKQTLKDDINLLDNVSGMSTLVRAKLKQTLNEQVDSLTDSNLNELKEELKIIKDWVDEQVGSENTGDKDTSKPPVILPVKDTENYKKVAIKVTSTNTIVSLKIAKKDKYNDKIDFTTQGTDIDIVESSDIETQYTATEDGIYVIFAKDNKGNTSTYQLYLGTNKTPISADTAVNKRTVNMHITDSVCKIVKIKVAKSSSITDMSDFQTIGDNINFVSSNSVDIEYTVPEDDTYAFYIEDEAGYKKQITVRATESKSINIDVTQDDENNKGILTIKATDTIANIVKIKVAIGNDIDINYFTSNGEELTIQQGKEVKVNYTVDKNCILNVYAEDADGYKSLATRSIIGVDAEESEPPVIEVSQNNTNLKQIDVTVTGKDSYISEVKWAEGSHDESYFESNGTTIGETSVGKIKTASFEISKTGIYTVYAKDQAGKTAIKEINIKSIEELDPSQDTVAPEITGVTDKAIYNNAVTPVAKDDNLNMVELKKNGTKVENYKNNTEISEEGSYELTATDKAGNSTTVNFIIDKTAPQIDSKQTATSNTEVLLTITAKDSLTKIAKIKIANDSQKLDYFKTGGQELGLTENDLTSTAEIKLSQNGTYTVYAEDEAGNADIKEISINSIGGNTGKDTTAPKVTGVTDKAIYNKNVTPSITDENLDTIELSKDEEIIENYKNNTEISEEGKYELVAKDKAGNTTTVTFTIDKTAPEIETDESETDDGYIELVITATDNITTVKKIKIASGSRSADYFKNGGQDLEVQESTAKIIIKSNGNYTVYAEDEAGNGGILEIEITEISGNDEDTTPPMITGVEDGETYTTEVTPEAYDENLDKVTLEQDGKEVANYKNGDAISENGNYKLTATDKAGNFTTVSFTIRLSDEGDGGNNNGGNNNNGNNNSGDDNNQNNDNSNNGNNQNNAQNTNGNNSQSSNNQGTNNNSNSGSTNQQINSQTATQGESNNGQTVTTTSQDDLPKTGLRDALLISGIAITALCAIVSFIRYKKIKK